jgi:hypothetical protein
MIDPNAIKFEPESHQYSLYSQTAQRWEPVPSVTQVLQAMGFVDTAFFTEESRTRGTYVHKLIELHISQELDENTVDESLHGYFDAFRRFREEADIDTDTWTVEKPLASKVHRFAGTPDFVGIINGRCAVIDLKTSATVSASEQLQTAAYKILIDETHQQGMPVTHRFSLHVSSEGKYKVIEHKDRQDAQIFKSALACYYWKLNNLTRRAA